MWYTAFRRLASTYYVLSRGGATRRPDSGAEGSGSGLVTLDYKKEHGEWMLRETGMSVIAAT